MTANNEESVMPDVTKTNLQAQVDQLTARVAALEAILARSGAPRLLGITELEKRVHKDRSTIFRWVQAGTFPAPAYRGRDRVWPEAVVRAWELNDEEALAAWEPGG